MFVNLPSIRFEYERGEERRGEEVRVGEEGSLGMMPAFRTVKLRRKSCALGRRTKSQARAVWRILYRLVFRVSA